MTMFAGRVKKMFRIETFLPGLKPFFGVLLFFWLYFKNFSSIGSTKIRVMALLVEIVFGKRS